MRTVITFQTSHRSCQQPVHGELYPQPVRGSLPPQQRSGAMPRTGSSGQRVWEHGRSPPGDDQEAQVC